MRLWMCGLPLVALAAASLSAADPAPLPKGLPPVYATAVAKADGRAVKLTVTCPRPRWRVVEGKENPDAPKLSTPRSVEVAAEKATIEVRLVNPEATQRAQTRVVGLDGKALSPADLLKRLEKETAVLVAADGRAVDPYYLQLVKADTLVVELSTWDGAPATDLFPAAAAEKGKTPADPKPDKR